MASRVPPDVLAAIDTLAERVHHMVRENMRLVAANITPHQLQTHSPDELALRMLFATFDCAAFRSEFDEQYREDEQVLRRAYRQL